MCRIFFYRRDTGTGCGKSEGSLSPSCEVSFVVFAVSIFSVIKPTTTLWKSVIKLHPSDVSTDQRWFFLLNRVHSKQWKITQVWQFLDCCAADSQAKVVRKSAVQQSENCQTWAIFHCLVHRHILKQQNDPTLRQYPHSPDSDGRHSCAACSWRVVSWSW